MLHNNHPFLQVVEETHLTEPFTAQTSILIGIPLAVLILGNEAQLKQVSRVITAVAGEKPFLNECTVISVQQDC